MNERAGEPLSKTSPGRRPYPPRSLRRKKEPPRRRKPQKGNAHEPVSIDGKYREHSAQSWWRAGADLSRQQRNGSPDARVRLVAESPRASRALAAEPQDLRANHADIAPSDVRVVGRASHPSLQRRVRRLPAHKASHGAGVTGAHRMARGLAGGRPTRGVRDAPQRRHVRRSADVDLASKGVPRGDVRHLLVQPDTRRQRRLRRDPLPGHRGDGAHHR